MSIDTLQGSKWVDKPLCPTCGAKGRLRYPLLTDRIFSVPGQWQMSQCSDASCDTYWLDPAPIDELLPTFYSTYHTHSLEARHGIAKQLFSAATNGYISSRFGYRSEATIVSLLGRWAIAAIPTLRDDAAARVFWLSSKERGTLLEVGFGNAATMARMQGLGWSVVGVEFDPVSVELARSKQLDVFLGTLEDVRFSAERFDAVVASHVIEHVPEPKAFLRECARVLRPGGRLILTTPNSRSLGHRLFASNWRGLEPPRHLALFGPKALKRLADEAGFRRVHVKTTSRGGQIISQSLRLALHGNPSRVTRFEVESTALMAWAITAFVGRTWREELCLECWR